MTLRVAVVGTGMMGRAHAQSYEKGGLDAEVAYVVGRSRERAEELARLLRDRPRGTDDLEEALADPGVDVIDLCTPTATHHRLVLRAAAAGKHVLCEKPVALTMAEAEAMVSACEKQDVCFMVGHVLRFWPEYVAAVDLVREGRIGELRHIACTRLSSAPTWTRTGWITDPSQGGGAVRDLAIHDYDFIYWLAGTPTHVTATGDPSHFVASFDLLHGAHAHVEASYAMPAGAAFRMGFRVVGTTGAVEFDGTAGQITLATAEGTHTLPVAGSRTFNQDSSESELDAYFYEIQYFLDCIRAGRQPARCTPTAALEALRTALRVELALGHVRPPVRTA